MSYRLGAVRIDRMSVHFAPAPGLPSAAGEIAAYMLGTIATFAFIIALTYAAIGLWRMALG